MAENLDTKNSPTVEDTSAWVSLDSISIYEFMESMYEGSGPMRDGTFLVPFHREQNYKRRRTRTFYRNFLRPVNDARVKPVFSEEITRVVTNDSGTVIENKFTDFLDNVDNAGTKMSPFMEDIMTESSLQAADFIVMDNFPADEMSDIDADNRTNRKFPYLIEKTSDQVYSSKLNRFGGLDEIVFTEVDRITGEGRNKKTIKIFRKWTDTFSQIWTKENGKFVVLDEPIPHNLGVIPVRPVYTSKRRKLQVLIPSPSLYDIARINWAIFNKDSIVDDLEVAQGFSLLVIPGKGVNFVGGPGNALFYPPDSKNKPEYISPDPAINESLKGTTTELKISLFEIAEQNGVTASLKAESGIAKAYNFTAHNTTLKNTANISKNAEIWISEVFKLYVKEDFNYNVEYRKDYQLAASLEKISISERVLDVNASPKANKVAKKAIVEEAFANRDKAELAEVIADIEAQTDDQIKSEGDPE